MEAGLVRCFILYKEDYPWDVRVEKIANTLQSNGFETYIIARNRSNKDKVDKVGALNIFRLPITKHLPKFLQFVVNLPVWFNPFWAWTLYCRTRNSVGGVLIVRDLPLAKLAIIISKINGLHAILDMAECYPEMYRSSAELGSRKLINVLLKNHKIASIYEASVIKQINHVFVMVEESRERLLRKGLPQEKITIVSNTPIVDKFKHIVHRHHQKTLRIVYVGFLSKLRGLDILVNAISSFLRKGYEKTDISLDIIGKGGEKEFLERLVVALGIEDCVRIHGWLSQEEIDKIMASANVGALTYRVCGHWNHTIPNKIFDYMLAGLPVLSTEVIPIKRIITENNCGVVCDGNNISDVVKKLESLRDPSFRETLGKNGNNAVIEKYNWKTDESRLLNVIKKSKL